MGVNPDGFGPITIPLATGLGQETPINAGPKPSFQVAVNLDFGKRGALRGRPGYVRATGGYNVRGADTSARPTLTNVADLGTTGYTPTGMFADRDSRGERPGLATNGRIFTYEGNAWVDRLGAGATRVERLGDTWPEIVAPLNPGNANRFVVPAMAYDFGFLPTGGLRLFTSNGDIDADVAGPGTTGPGGGAAVTVGGVRTTALVYVSGANLIFLYRTGGARTVTAVTLATDAVTPTGYGDNPVICGDFNTQSFFVAYRNGTTTTHLIKVSPTGVVSGSSASFGGSGTGPKGIWVTNSSVTDDKVILCVCNNNGDNVLTTVVYHHDLTSYSIDRTFTGAIGPVVAGVAQGGNVWLVYLTTSGGVTVRTRSLTTTASLLYNVLPGTLFPTSLVLTGVEDSVFWFILHQPVLVNGRVVLGLVSGRYATGGGPDATNVGDNVFTWYSVDLTDMWAVSTTTGSRLFPVLLGRGQLETTAEVWNPVPAVVGSDNQSYRVPTLDFRQLFSKATGSATGHPAYLLGTAGAFGLNEVSFIGPASTRAGDTTILSGSIPRGLSRGSAYEIGFPFLGAPPFGLSLVADALGSIPAGSYTGYAVWRWTDEAGQIHRSAPSYAYTIVTAGDTKSLVFTAGACLLTDRRVTDDLDRGGVQIEFYLTDANPTPASPHLLVATVAPTPASSSSSFTMHTPMASRLGNDTLYTDGLVLPNRPVSAQGGVVTVGSRTWVSDGRNLYASRLGVPGNFEASSWNTDGPLVVAVPGSAGRVVALSALDEKVVALCERGVYVTGGQGPNDIGLGPDFIAPQRVADVGVAGTRSYVYTPKGVFFQVASTDPNDSVDGGIWLLDRSLTVSLKSWAARDDLDIAQAQRAGDLTYLPEDDHLVFRLPPTLPTDPGYVIGLPPPFPAYGARFPGALLIYDFRVDAWTDWSYTPDGSDFVTSVSGALWIAGVDVGGFTNPPNTGYDDVNGVHTVFPMQLITSAVPGDGQTGLGWSRVRALTVLGDTGFLAQAHDLTTWVYLDEAQATYTTTFAGFSPGTTVKSWPVARYAPEWRLPSQRASTIQVALQANPAVATWTALELVVKLLPRRAPSGSRR